MEAQNLNLSEYPDLTLEELDTFLRDIEEIKTDPAKLDKMYLSTLFIKKIFPKLNGFNKIFRFLKYHIFNLHPKIDIRLVNLEEEVVALRSLLGEQRIELEELKTLLSQGSTNNTVN